MTFGELKRSTLYQTSDFDDLPVMICVSRKGKKQLEPLCFLGLMPGTNPELVVIGGLTEIQRMVEGGEIPKPKDYIDPKISNPMFFDDEENGK